MTSGHDANLRTCLIMQNAVMLQPSTHMPLHFLYVSEVTGQNAISLALDFHQQGCIAQMYF